MLCSLEFLIERFNVKIVNVTVEIIKIKSFNIEIINNVKYSKIKNPEIIKFDTRKDTWIPSDHLNISFHDTILKPI